MQEIVTRLKPTARALLAAWGKLPRRGAVPDRHSFDPTAIPAILPVVSLIERRADDEWLLRLVGTEIERRWGKRLTGCNYLDLVSAAAVDATRAEFRAVVEQPCGSWSKRDLALRSGLSAVVETIRLPLRGGDGRVNLILSCSGEVSREYRSADSEALAIAAIAEHQFFDIGAGVPN